MFSSGSAGGNGGAASRVNSNMDVGFNSGVAARIEDLPRVNTRNFRGHGRCFSWVDANRRFYRKLRRRHRAGQKGAANERQNSAKQLRSAGRTDLCLFAQAVSGSSMLDSWRTATAR